MNRRLPPDCQWHFVANRVDFLADSTNRKFCFLVDSDFGKTTVLSQLAHVRSYYVPSRAVSNDSAAVMSAANASFSRGPWHFVVAIQFTDLPSQCDDYFDNSSLEDTKRLRTCLKSHGRNPTDEDLNRWLVTLANRGDLGNACEWTSTWYFDNSLLGLDPRQASTSRVLRGGSFNCYAFIARCSLRIGLVPALSVGNSGCRVARASSRKS